MLTRVWLRWQGAALADKIVVLGDRAVQLDMWDTPGSGRMRHLARMYYRAADVRVLRPTYPLHSKATQPCVLRTGCHSSLRCDVIPVLRSYERLGGRA
jgi:hypothetical protein